MSKRTRLQPRTEKPNGPWPVTLVAMAAAGRSDGGIGLQHLLQEAGFAEKPAMSIIVKRPRPVRHLAAADGWAAEHGRVIDPYVDDVLDALRALCA